MVKVLARRAVQVVIGLAMVAGVAIATEGVALAAGVGGQTCRGETNRYAICFMISYYGVKDFKVHIGIDVSMSRQDAQNIIDAPGQEFSARLYGQDTFSDDTLRSVPVTWSAAWDGGLSAEFDSVALQGMLDEDGGEDEIYAVVWLYIPSTGTTRRFQTNTVVGYF